MSSFRADADREAGPSAAGGDVEGVRRAAKGLVTGSSRVLLVRERHADGDPFWTLPGGGVRPTESLAEGLRREFAEELSCGAVVDDLVATFPYAHRGSSRLSVYGVFDCAVTAAVDPVRGEGILATRWVPPRQPPARTLPQVQHLLAGLETDRLR